MAHVCNTPDQWCQTTRRKCKGALGKTSGGVARAYHFGNNGNLLCQARHFKVGWIDRQLQSVTQKQGRAPTLLCPPFSLRSKSVIQKTSAKIAGDYWKQVKASRPFVDGPRMTSDGRADRCAVFEEHMRCLLRESSVFAVFV